MVAFKQNPCFEKNAKFKKKEVFSCALLLLIYFRKKSLRASFTKIDHFVDLEDDFYEKSVRVSIELRLVTSVYIMKLMTQKTDRAYFIIGKGPKCNANEFD